MKTPKPAAAASPIAVGAIDLDYEVLNRAEAAAILDVHARTLDDWHERGEGPPVCILGGSRRYLKSSVLAWVKSKETTPADARRVRPGNRKPRAAQAAPATA